MDLSILSRSLTLLERSFYVISCIYDPTYQRLLNTVRLLEVMSIAVDFFVVKNAKACTFHSTYMYPSMNVCQLIRFCAKIADNREAEVHLGILLVLYLTSVAD